jgi:tetratricopeptide (TPR) repeat protein
MKKHITFAMVPVMLAMSITLALAEPKRTAPQKPMPTQKTSQQTLSMRSPMMITAPASMMATTMPTKAHPLMVEGQTALINRKYAEAVQAFQNLLSTNPNHVQALNGLSIALLNQGNYDEAQKMIDKALSLDPVNSRLHYTKAQVLDAQNKPIDAVEAYLTFAAMAPNDGAALAAQGRAEELYKESLAGLTPPEGQYVQGLRFLCLHQPEEAIAPLEQCKSMAPDNQKANLMLGCAYLQSGRTDKAIHCFEDVLKTQSNPVAYYQLGSSYQMRGETQNAQNAFRKFMQIAPQSEVAAQMTRMMEISSQR